MAHTLIPANGKFSKHPDPVCQISREDAAEILSDPARVMDVAEVMQTSEVGIATAWHAIRNFGKDESLACRPDAMLGRTSDGRLLGPDGWRRVRDFVSDHISGDGSRGPRWMRGSYWVPGADYYSNSHYYEASEIFEVLSSGMTDSEAAELIKSGLTGHQLVAVATGAASRPVADGWL